MKLFSRKALKSIEAVMDSAQPVENQQPAQQTINNLTFNDLVDRWDLAASSSGIHITPEGAMRISAVFACVRLISGIISTLPIQVFERKPGAQIDTEIYDHPVEHIFNRRANERESAAALKRTQVASYLLDGNGFGGIDRDRAGEPVAVKSWAFSRTQVDYLNTEFGGGDDEAVVYRYTTPLGRLRSYVPDDALHFAGPGLGTLQGYHLRAPSPIRLHAGTMGVSQAAEDHAGNFFRNGANPGGVIEYPEEVGKELAAKISDQWERKHAGLGNSHKPAILSEGGTWKDVGMNAEDAQLLQTRSWQVTDIARIFGVPPHLIGEMAKSTAWGSGLTEQVKGFLLFTINDILEPYEQEISYKCFPTDGSIYALFNREALTEGDLKTRVDAFKAALGGNQLPGHMSVNEVRAKRKLPPSPEPWANEIYKPVAGAKSEKFEDENDDSEPEGQVTQ